MKLIHNTFFNVAFERVLARDKELGTDTMVVYLNPWTPQPDQPGPFWFALSYISIESSGECEWRDIPDAARYPFYLSQQRYEDRGSRLDRGRGREHVSLSIKLG